MEVACKTSALLQPPGTPIRNEATPKHSHLVLRNCPKAPHASWLLNATSLLLLQDKHPSISPSPWLLLPQPGNSRRVSRWVSGWASLFTKEERVSDYVCSLPTLPIPRTVWRCGSVGYGGFAFCFVLTFTGWWAIKGRFCNGINGRRCFR